VGDRAEDGGAYSNLGCFYKLLGHFSKAIEYYTQRLAIAMEVGDRAGAGRTGPRHRELFARGLFQGHRVPLRMGRHKDICGVLRKWRDVVKDGVAPDSCTADLVAFLQQ
jgi:hypothetical protein